jgi:23S rRNA (cytosine1962-C5)-methyltransferase
LESVSKIFVKPNREEAILRRHPWVFSGAIGRVEGSPADGDVVHVCTHRGAFLALGHFFNGSIAVKIFSYEPALPDGAFWQNKLQNALNARKLVVANAQITNCYRLVHGEGDGLPGLVIDFYDGVAVLQAHSVGMYRNLPDIATALRQLYGSALKAIYHKSHETLPETFAKNVENGYLWGHCPVPHPVVENGKTFLIDWETGQKTGFFIDQRDNRALLAHYAKDKQVLNAFCYSGGFSVYALAAGAQKVDSIDASKKAIELVERNVAANFGEEPRHQAYAEDTVAFLRRTTHTYDLMVLDPPAYAKSMAKRHQAVQGYKRLNAEGIRCLQPNGILFTFSCSQVVDRELFYNTIVAAALEAGRQVRVLHQLTQAPDHPVNFFHPEGSYLKGLVLLVE